MPSPLPPLRTSAIPATEPPCAITLPSGLPVSIVTVVLPALPTCGPPPGCVAGRVLGGRTVTLAPPGASTTSLPQPLNTPVRSTISSMNPANVSAPCSIAGPTPGISSTPGICMFATVSTAAPAVSNGANPGV